MHILWGLQTYFDYENPGGHKKTGLRRPFLQQQ